jgi:NAD(P)-dependent dehydrogenase (short-subunit alcohol dehydrogenase family)
MSADDQAFLDIVSSYLIILVLEKSDNAFPPQLSSVPNDIRRYSNDVADYVDKHLEKVANTLREALSSSKWIPENARPRPPPPPPRTATLQCSATRYSQIHDWVLKNKILTAVIVTAAGGLIYHIIKKKSNRKKRRARRAPNGARVEVVVVAGSPSEPITRSISLDLERRGFIVYIVCNTIEEEILVQNESRPDIKPLMIDIVDVSSSHLSPQASLTRYQPESTRASIDRFKVFLQAPHAVAQGIKQHHLILRSLILIPTPNYPSLPIATLAPSALSDLLNTRLLTPILILQSFLPLLQALPLQHPHQHPGLARPPIKPSVLVLTPSIISNLSPAFHLPESAIVSALSSFTSVLSSELQPLGIPVTHLQLGTFDTSPFVAHNRQLTVLSQRAEMLKWEESARHAYGKNYATVTSKTGGGGVVGKGSSLRELNNAVFDAMVRGKGGVVRVGMGSRVYGFVGRWVPSGLVGWMMGVRGVGDKEEFGRTAPGATEGLGSRSTSPGSSASGGNVNVHGLGLGESEYISVYGENRDELGLPDCEH